MGSRIPKGVTQDGHDFVIPVKVSDGGFTHG